METIRLILFVVLAFLLLQIWQNWQMQNQPAVAEQSPQAQRNDYPVAEEMVEPASTTEVPVTSGEVSTTPQDRPATLVTVETDTLIVEIDSRGALPVRAWLKQYPVTPEEPDELIIIFDDSLSRQNYLQSGAVANSGHPSAPNHTTLFAIDEGDYQLAEGEKKITLKATARLESGIELQRELTFHRGSYQIEIASRLINHSQQVWNGRFYHQLVRAPGSGAERSFFAPASYEGAAFYTPEEKYNKVDYGDIAEGPMSLATVDGWVAMLEHYFVAALVPEAPERFYTKALDGQRFAVGSITPAVAVGAGSQVENNAILYLGPKEQHRLESISPGLELTTDFGMLTFLAQPLFWVLKWLNGIFGNWGWAIIGVTVILKALFFPLSAVGYRSMAKMKNVQPKMVALREAYADDKTLLNQKMMELYRNEKINPLGGCLPILIQIPVFIALYWVLLESVELRQAGFIFWITDLSQKDPIYVLPILMGASMFIQQMLNPAQLEPIQQKVMMAMPVIFTFFFLTFPSGLVLYWVVNNILSILQQWQITRKYATA
ncbi:MAG: membrane protein insertase YidC [Gammaproteobacteria bacterium]